MPGGGDDDGDEEALVGAQHCHVVEANTHWALVALMDYGSDKAEGQNLYNLEGKMEPNTPFQYTSAELDKIEWK